MHIVKINRLLRLSSLYLMVVATACCFMHCETGDEKQLESLLEEGFSNPSTEYRALALWPWLNGYVDTVKLVYELEEMKYKGMRGAIIWDIGALADPDKMIPVGPSFLGEQSLKYIAVALNTSDRLGLDLGMVASSSWNAGGAWVDSADASMQLLSTSVIVEGPSRQNITIGVPESSRGKASRYSLLTSIAVPYSADRVLEDIGKETFILDEFTTADQQIEWEVPEGKWELLSFFMANTGQNLVVPSPNSSGLVIDHLSRRATQNHFDSMLSRLNKVNTPDKHLKFLMLDSYEVWPMKDWSPAFIKEFSDRYEYDPRPYLPLLLDHEAEDSIVSERFRGDYSRLVSDMMIENHFGQSVDIADRHGIQMLTEAGHGGYPRVDPLKALGHSHIPMGEFWNRRWFWVTKEAASAAHIYGLKVVASESLTGWNHWQQGPADFKQLIDIAFCQGLNQVVFHTFAHNPEVAGKPGFVYHAGEHVNVNATWWEMSRPFMDYIARSSYLLRQGNFVGDACLYYGDQAPNLVPPERIDPNITPRFSEHTCLHCGKPKPVDPGNMEGYDFDYMNADVIVNAMQVEDGRLVLPSGQSYRVMQLPEREDISLEVLRRLKELVNAGAVIVGRRPVRTTSLKNYPANDDEVKDIADELWGEIDGVNVFSNNYGAGKVYYGKSLKQVLRELGVAPDFTVTGDEHAKKHIDYIHRQTATEDIYFIANSSQEEERVRCTFRVDNDRIPQLWDALSGRIQKNVAFTQTEKGISIELLMPPLSSRFVVFSNWPASEEDSVLSNSLQFAIAEEDIAYKIDISRDWKINFDPDMGGPVDYSMQQLSSWADAEDEGVKYYSGTAEYSQDFVMKASALAQGKEAYVRFENIQEIAKVYVNGEDCGIVWTPPYTARLTPSLKAGVNHIRIKVANTWNNRIVGDMRNPDTEAYTKTNAKSRFEDDKDLLKSGLIGRAEILFVQ